MNPKPKSFTNRDFLNMLIRASKEDHSVITPFVGSGVSAPSGILMGQDFTEFLAYTVYLVIEKGWDIRRHGWPVYPDSTQAETAKQSIRASYDALLHRYKESLKIDGSVPIPGTEGSDSFSSRYKDLDLIRPLKPEILCDWESREQELFLQRRRETLGINNKPQDPNISTSSDIYVRDLAIRSLWHWTHTLRFLSEIAIDHPRNMKGGTPRPALYLTEPESYVIDSFNWHITQGKRPNLIHNMLARLARSMGNQIVLSTNFDTLIEQSFEKLKEPIHVLAVSIRGGLPAFSTVRSQMTLIKLHGDLLETRADSSINDPPTPSDKERFYNYLRGPRKPHKPAPHDFMQSHLLVMGYSANDARCVQMIKGVLDYDAGFRVFWVCHTHSGADRIRQLFSEYRTLGENAQIIITVTDRTDLLLWELYQRLNLCLPSGGFSFQFSHNIPPAPAHMDQEDRSQGSQNLLVTQVNSAGERSHPVWKAINDVVTTTASSSGALHLEVNGQSGVAGPMRAVFQGLSNKHKQCIWLELEDDANPRHMLCSILEIIALRLGRFQLDWVNLVPVDLLTGPGTPRDEDDQKHAKFENTEDGTLNSYYVGKLKLHLAMLINQMGIAPSNWCVFLYGRNGPGGCVGMRMNYWTPTEYGPQLQQILGVLANLGLRIIHMKFDQSRFVRNQSKANFVSDLLEKLSYREEGGSKIPVYTRSIASQRSWFDKLTSTKISGSSPGHLPNSVCIWNILTDSKTMVKANRLPREATPPHGYEKSLEAVFSLPGLVTTAGIDNPDAPQKTNNLDFAIWLYGATLFRKARHSSALISEALFPCPERFNVKKTDNDEERSKIVFGPTDNGDPSWVSRLEENGILLRKPGGYAWKYRDMRLGMQWILDHRIWNTENELTLWVIRPRIHFWIGDWYLRAFYATGHHSPLIEAIYHFFSAIDLSRFYVPKPEYSPPSSKIDLERVLQARQRLAWRAACQLELALDVGTKSLKFWCSGIPLDSTFFRSGDKSNLADELKGMEFDPISGTELTSPGFFIDERDEIPLFIQSLKNLVNSVLAEKVIAIQTAVKTEGGRHHSHMSQRSTASKEESFCLDVPHETDDLANPKSWTVMGFKSQFGKKRDPLLDDMNHGIPWFPWSAPKCAPSKRKFWPVIDKEGNILPSPVSAEMSQETSDQRAACRLAAEAFQQLMSSWIHNGAKDEQLFATLWKSIEVAYRLIRRAQMEHTGRTASPDNLRLWQHASVICHVTLDAARSLTGESRESGINLRIRGLIYYGLCLGAMRRFSEANRRLNESHALLSRGQLDSSSEFLSQIHIRRAEVYLFDCKIEESARGEDGSITKAGAKIVSRVDSAWAALEKGEAILSGAGHPTLWWAKIASIKLHCYSALAEHKIYTESDQLERRSSLPFRRRLDLAASLIDLLRRSFLLGQDDGFRSLRAILHFVGASRLVLADVTKSAEDSKQSVRAIIECLGDDDQASTPDWTNPNSQRISDIWKHIEWARSAEELDGFQNLRDLIKSKASGIPFDS